MSSKIGIYFVIRNHKIVYIGQTIDFVGRMQYHKSQCMEWDHLRFIPCRQEDLLKYETRWIAKFKPEDNCQNKPKAPEPERKFYRVTKQRVMKFRKLTKKSLIGFGSYKDRCVDEIMRNGHIFVLTNIYFGLSHITFFDEILDELKITGEWRIEKPGVDKEKGYRFNSEVWPDEYSKYVSGKNRSLKVQARKHLEYLNAAANSKGHNRDVNQRTLR